MDSSPNAEGSAFSADEILMPRWWAEGFSSEEVVAETIEAIRSMIRNSLFLSKKLPNLRSHLKYTNAVLKYMYEHSPVFRELLTCSSPSKNYHDLFLSVVSELSALANDADNYVVNYNPTSHFDIGLIAAKNRRRTMEDQYIVLPDISLWPHLISTPNECPNYALFAVMDGHGGQHASAYTARHFPNIVYNHLSSSYSSDLRHVLEESLNDVERMFCARASRLGHLRVGSTIVALLMDLKSGHCQVSWIGDSRADLFKFTRQANDFHCDVVKLTVPLHRPGNDIEKKRIESVGGFVSGSGENVPRVNGQLSISRSIGDCEFKQQALVSAEPQFRSFDFSLEHHPKNQFEILLISSDGLWDGLSSTEIESIITESLKKELYKTDPDWLNGIAQKLVATASVKSDDNITCILISGGTSCRMSKFSDK